MKRSDFLQQIAWSGAGLTVGGVTGCGRGENADAKPGEAVAAEWAPPRDAVGSGDQSAVEWTRDTLARIEALDRRGPRVQAVIEVNPDALEIAESLDRERVGGKTRGPLHGVPVMVKDNLDTHDRMMTTAGSLALMGSIAPRDAHVVGLLRAAGLVLAGKTNLSEWANFRGSRSTSGWSGRGGQTRNPHCLDRTPSGSSSGSAAAVAAGYVPFAVGTETNGSIVSPASYCGIVGIKPTVGLVSRAGIIPISSSQDTAGPMARTVTDAAALLAIMLGVDPRDPATERQKGRVDGHVESLLAPKAMPGARLGVARELFDLHPLVDPVFAGAVEALRALGADLTDPVELPTYAELARADYRVMIYEYKAGLNDYFASLGDAAPVKSIEELIAFNERESARELWLFGQERLIEAAAVGPLTDPEYLDAVERCRRWGESLVETMDRHQVDAIVAPTNGPAGVLDYIHGERGLGGCAGYAAVSGLPHITVPCGEVFGLPVGLSFFGRAWTEPLLVNIALAFEQATAARRTPDFRPMVEVPAPV
jgi:amidase